MFQPCFRILHSHDLEGGSRVSCDAHTSFIRSFFDHRWRFRLVRVLFPSQRKGEEDTFQLTHSFTLPENWDPLKEALDPAKKRLAISFIHQRDKSMHVFVVLDWEADLATRIDSGLPYVRVLRFPCFTMTHHSCIGWRQDKIGRAHV